ncbi:phosphoglycerol transferase [Caballeronia udeis]|uniref:Phosphoglycerol transferase n=1 Tax=Caballeronia udeis TaxID=1232866 RepID=A0ABW8MPT1_9BURK
MTDIFAKPFVETRLESTRPALKWGVPAALVVLATLMGWFLIGGTGFNLNDPLAYNGDGMLILALIKRVMDGTWLFHSDLMGAPFGSYLYDYPIPDSGSLFVLKWLGLMSGSPAVALNLYYLLGFPINALSAYLVLRKLRVSMALSFAGGFVFTILPFHFERVGHLFYTWYFAAPIFVWYAFKIYRGEYALRTEKSGRPVAHIKHALLLLVLSCFGVYYSFFGVLTFIVAGMMRYLRMRSLASIYGAVLAIVIVAFGIVANVTPNLIDRVQHGANHETAARSPIEAEIYGLKTVQLLLPRIGHRFEPLAKVTTKYSATFPLVNENMTASLGFIGSIGFVALLLSIFAPRAQQDERIFLLASVTLALLLFCSIGGFSSLFAVLITPMIRAWNRVSVFIAFTSIAASLLMLEQLLARDWAKRNAARWTTLTALGLCAFAYWDQTTPSCVSCLQSSSTDFNSDARFVADIEKQVPKGSTIYQLPYVGFPEVPPVNNLGTYDLASGYLHSKALGWSWGTMKGRPGDLFFREMASEPMEQQIATARKLCFSGVYLDRRGYTDGGAAVEAQLQQILGRPAALVSGTKQQVFFNLVDGQHPACALPAGITPDQMMEHANLVVDNSGVKYHAALSDGINFSRPGLPDFLKQLDGLSGVEPWGRWSDASLDPSVRLRFTDPLPAHFVLHLRAQGFGPNVGKPTRVAVGNEVQSFMPSAAPTDQALSFSNPKGADLITITPAQAISPKDLGTSSDDRRLGLGMEQLWIETAP